MTEARSIDERGERDAEMTADEWSVLMRAPLFKAVGPAITRSLVQKRSARAYDRGEQIFQQGDPADAFFLIIEGCVKLYREREGGEQVVVAIFAAGETFAEAAMFLGGAYLASAEAVTTSRILRIMAAHSDSPFCGNRNLLSPYLPPPRFN